MPAVYLEAGQDGAKGHDAELRELSESAHIAQPRVALTPNSVPPPLQALELRLQMPHHPCTALSCFSTTADRAVSIAEPEQ